MTPPKTYNVMMFGDNRKGACGLDHIENKYIYCPVEMRGHRFIKMACGQLHCMGINQQGKDRPPPVAMKRNPVTGEMEEFHSEKLKDDLPEEEAESCEVEIPVGDDY